MNKTIKKVLNIIEKNGYEAYVVGGYVRDFLLKKTSYDIDICTNALPKDLKAIFKNGELTDYGNLFFKIKKFDFEITTYRKEIAYENRKPKKVEYINNLIEDLQRRDFTINTLCMNQDGLIIDLLNGSKDLNNRLIKMVGNADKKIKEDPLRILRAIRFATILNFKIEKSLEKSIAYNYSIVKTLSSYRIKEELDKILMSENALKGVSLLTEFKILELLKIKPKVNLIKVNDLIGMWAQFEILSELPFTKEDKNNIIKLKDIIKGGKIDNFTLYKYGLYLCCVAGEILNVDKIEINRKYKNLPIYSAKDVCISSEYLIKNFKIADGKQLGEILNDLINKILSEEISNTRESINAYLCYLKERK